MNAFGLLAECLTDADRESRGRARTLRGRSIAAALVIETAMAGALLIWPLTHLGVLGQAPDLLPRPVFFTSQPAPIIGERRTTLPHEGPIFEALNLQPVISPHRSQQRGIEAPPGLDPIGDNGPAQDFLDLGGRNGAANLPPPPHPSRQNRLG